MSKERLPKTIEEILKAQLQRAKNGMFGYIFERKPSPILEVLEAGSEAK